MTSRFRFSLLVSLSVGAAVCSSDTLRAHGLEARARAGQDGVRVEAFFHEGRPLENLEITVADAEGTVHARGRTDARGVFRFQPVHGVDLIIVAGDDAGHRAVIDLPASRFEAKFEPGDILADSRRPWLAQNLPRWLGIVLGVAAIAALAIGALFVYRWRRTSRAG